MEETTVIAYNAFVLWIAGIFSLITLIDKLYPQLCKLHDFVFKKIGVKTKRMLKREEDEKRLKNVEQAIIEIKDTAKHNVNMFLEHEKQVVGSFEDIKNEIVNELNKLHIKIDAQKAEIDKNNEASRETDCVMLRDRIASGMRYFGQHKDNNGNVHISFSDYENMEALFQEYFSKNGNGAFKKMYETEFQKYIIDR